MSIYLTLSALLCATLVSSQGISTEGTCGTLDNSLKTNLDHVFDNLPEEYVDTEIAGTELLLPKLILEKAVLSGLNNLQPNRPYHAFCKGGTKHVLVTLRSAKPLEYRATWSFCDVQNGTITTIAGIAQYEAEIAVANSSENSKPRLTLSRLTPVVLESLSVEARYLGPLYSTAITLVGYLLTGFVRLFWVDVASLNVHEVLVEQLSKMS